MPLPLHLFGGPSVQHLSSSLSHMMKFVAGLKTLVLSFDLFLILWSLIFFASIVFSIQAYRLKVLEVFLYLRENYNIWKTLGKLTIWKMHWKITSFFIIRIGIFLRTSVLLWYLLCFLLSVTSVNIIRNSIKRFYDIWNWLGI